MGNDEYLYLVRFPASSRSRCCWGIKDIKTKYAFLEKVVSILTIYDDTR